MNARYRKLIEQAACREAEPHLFDMTDHFSARYALAYCRTCPVIKLCELEIDPQRNFYDGVVGGLVYANGNVVEPKKR